MIQPSIAKAVFDSFKTGLNIYYVNTTPYKLQMNGMAKAAREQSKRTITNTEVKRVRDELLKADFGKNSKGEQITVEDIEIKLSRIYMPMNHTGFVVTVFMYINMEEGEVVGYQAAYDLHSRVVSLVPIA